MKLVAKQKKIEIVSDSFHTDWMRMHFWTLPMIKWWAHLLFIYVYNSKCIRNCPCHVSKSLTQKSKSVLVIDFRKYLHCIPSHRPKSVEARFKNKPSLANFLTPKIQIRKPLVIVFLKIFSLYGSSILNNTRMIFFCHFLGDLAFFVTRGSSSSRAGGIA